MPKQINNDNITIENDNAIGVISDTHGLLRPEVRDAFAGVELILHAGDVGDPDVMSELEMIAPLIAVRGNMDYGSWAERLPVARSVQIGDHAILLVHDAGWIDRNMDLTPYQMVVNGHTHRPRIEEQNGRVYFNPGSAGHRRHQYPLSVGKLTVGNGQLLPDLITLNT